MEREKIGFDGIRCAWELLEERQPGPTGNGTLGQREGKLIRRVSVFTGSREKMLSLGEGGSSVGRVGEIGPRAPCRIQTVQPEYSASQAHAPQVPLTRPQSPFLR